MFQMGARENTTYEERLSNQQTDFTEFALATLGYATKRSPSSPHDYVSRIVPSTSGQ